jgi:hypothetical protein
MISKNAEIDASIRPHLKLSRETNERFQKTEYALVSSLQRDPLLADRIRRLRTVPGSGWVNRPKWTESRCAGQRAAAISGNPLALTGFLRCVKETGKRVRNR